jgi:hypothetical protein
MKRKRTADNLLAIVHQHIMDAAAVLTPEEMMQLIAQLRSMMDRTERVLLERWRGTT